MPSIVDLELDLPLEDTPASRFLAWIAGGLVFLAVLAFAVAAAADGTARRLGLEPRLLTVMLPAPTKPAASADEVERVVAAMKRAEGVAFVRPVPAQELSGLIQSWLGPGATASGLPMPRLIDVAFNPGREPDLEALMGQLETVSATATIEDLRLRRGDGREGAQALAALALGAGLLVAAALLVVIAVVTRMSLDLHEETVDLLRLMGAPDRYVARQFEHHALSNALRGGLLGFAIAILTLLGFKLTHAAFPGSALPGIGLLPLDWVLLGCVPVAAAVLTALVARATARWGLARLR
jgi:cell division transport system permease protein